MKPVRSGNRAISVQPKGDPLAIVMTTTPSAEGDDACRDQQREHLVHDGYSSRLFVARLKEE